MARGQLSLDFEAVPSATELLTADDVFQIASQSVLESLGEDPRFERKAPEIEPRTLGDSICMWANTSPVGGLLIVGQTNDGKIVGTSRISLDHRNKLEKACREFVPEARYDLTRVPVKTPQGDSFVLLMRVYYREDRVVETVAGEAFIRRGDSKYRLTHEERMELELDKGQRSLEQESAGLEYPNDFEIPLIQKFAASVVSQKQLRADHTAVEILANRKLGKLQSDGTFVPNIACALLFAKDPLSVVPGCSIRFQRYEGTERLTGERRNVVKDVSIEGRVPELIEEADRVIRSQVREFSTLGPKGKFFTAPEYPPAAWYEAVVNACVHRSYSLKHMTTFVRMFDDRLEVESPGGFLPFVTPENIYFTHHRRNFFLMDALFYVGLVKCENEGTRRMRDEMQAMDLPAPEFSQKSSELRNMTVRVTLRNNHNRRKLWIDKTATDVVGAAIFDQLDEREKRCVNFVAEHGRITVADVARLTGIDWKTGKKLLSKLVDMGLFEWVSRRANDSNAHYRLKRPKRPAGPTQT